MTSDEPNEDRSLSDEDLTDEAARQIEEIGHPLIVQSMDLLQELVDKRGLQVYFTHLNHSNPVLDPDGKARREVESRGFHILEDEQEFRF